MESNLGGNDFFGRGATGCGPFNDTAKIGRSDDDVPHTTHRHPEPGANMKRLGLANNDEDEFDGLGLA
ncbi:hypothetical protein ACFL2Q_13625 [Thermodesulfobacteriota bacterium]